MFEWIRSLWGSEGSSPDEPPPAPTLDESPVFEGLEPISVNVAFGAAMSHDGFSRVQHALDVPAASLWAVVRVEALNRGFMKDRRPLIKYEAHVFGDRTDHVFDATHPALSRPSWQESGPPDQYGLLASAAELQLDGVATRTQALESASWGLGQVMGFNASIAGFSDVDDMVTRMRESEDAQLDGIAGFVQHHELASAMRDQDWERFARIYNGPLHARNDYVGRLTRAFDGFSSGSLPDLDLRAAQLYLYYLGHNPASNIDGAIGSTTRGALKAYLASGASALRDQLHDDQVDRLTEVPDVLLADLEHTVAGLPAPPWPSALTGSSGGAPLIS